MGCDRGWAQGPTTPPSRPKTARATSPPLNNASVFQQVTTPPSQRATAHSSTAVKPAAHATALQRSPLKGMCSAAKRVMQDASESNTPRSAAPSRQQSGAWRIASVRPEDVVAAAQGAEAGADDTAHHDRAASGADMRLLGAGKAGTFRPHDDAELEQLLRQTAIHAMQGWARFRHRQLESSSEPTCQRRVHEDAMDILHSALQ